MGRFEGKDFTKKVGEVVAELERGSAAEVVVTVVPRADSYAAAPIVAGLVAHVFVLTVMVFAEAEFGDYLLYTAPLASFLAVYALARLSPFVLRRLVGRARARRATEILARATFQKAGLHRTREGTAVLVFAARDERQCVIVRDFGAELAMGASEWSAHETAFARALASRSPEAFVAALAELGKILGQRLPVRPDDIDELPSHVVVSFSA